VEIFAGSSAPIEVVLRENLFGALSKWRGKNPRPEQMLSEVVEP
jgi:hypothetical protein